MNSTGQQTRRNSDSAPAGRFQSAVARSPEGYRAGEGAAGQNLAMVLGHLACELLADEILRAGPGRAGHSALYAV